MQGLIFLCIPTNEEFLQSLSLQCTCVLAKSVPSLFDLTDAWIAKLFLILGIVGCIWKL